jgi:microcystin-dependent protein
MANLKISDDYAVDKNGYVQSYPVGSIVMINSATIPDGWLLCDGRLVNTFTYQELHKAISNTYGGTAYSAGTTDQSGAATTFNLPPIVVNASFNPSGRFLTSRVASEPSYPASFNHTHAIYWNNANINLAPVTLTHNHAAQAWASTAGNIAHNHTVWNTSVVSVAASNQTTNRVGGSGTFHNDIGHTHSAANSNIYLSDNYPNTDISTNVATGNNPTGFSHSHTHTLTLGHSSETFNHTHTGTFNSNVTTGTGTQAPGVNSGTANPLPPRMELYFIIKY